MVTTGRSCHRLSGAAEYQKLTTRCRSDWIPSEGSGGCLGCFPPFIAKVDKGDGCWCRWPLIAGDLNKGHISERTNDEHHKQWARRQQKARSMCRLWYGCREMKLVLWKFVFGGGDVLEVSWKREIKRWGLFRYPGIKCEVLFTIRITS